MLTRIRSVAKKCLACLVIATSPFISFSADAAESDWPSWRGPLHTGVAPAGNPPTKWSETENIRWKVKLPGSGSATPIVWGDQIFIQTAIPTGEKVGQPAAERAEAAATDAPAEEGRGRRGGRGGFRSEKPTETYRFVLLCLDRNSGKTLWEQVARTELPHEGHHKDHGFSSSSPVTDGTCVIAHFGSRGLYCYDMQGELLWEKDLGDMETKNDFGEGASPALYKNTVVVIWDHEGDDFIVALDKKSGDEIWRQPREEDTSWTTPLIVPHGDSAQVVTAATRKVRSYDLANGDLIWECDGLTANAIPSPVADEDTVYVTSGFRGNEMLAIKLSSKGDITGTDSITWSHDKSTPYVPSPLLYDNRLYFFAGNNAILSSFDTKTGKPVFGPSRINDLEGVYASPVGAAGRVYLVGRSGASVVIKHADELEVLATNKLDDRIDASPAIVGDTLLLRGHEYLYCVGE